MARLSNSVLKEGRNLSVLLEPNVSNPGKDFTRTPNCQWRAGRAHLPTSRLCQGPASADTELSSPRSFPLAVPPARATEAPRSPQKFSAQKQLTGVWAVRGTGRAPHQGYSRTRGNSRARPRQLSSSPEAGRLSLPMCLRSSCFFSVHLKCKGVDPFLAKPRRPERQLTRLSSGPVRG